MSRNVPPSRVARDALIYRMAAVIARTHYFTSAAMIRRYIPDARAILEEMERLDADAWPEANDEAWQRDRSTTEHTPEAVWPIMLKVIAKGRPL